MAESSLSITYTEISVRVAHMLGYDRTSGNWTADQTSDIQDAIDSGYRSFLSANDWRCLHKVGTITTAADDGDYDLADDFHYLLSHYLTYAADENRPAITEVSEGKIRDWINVADINDYPTHFAIRPKAFDGTAGMRYEALLYPTPSVVKVLSYAYRMFVPYLRAASAYPIGGMLMGEAVLYACLGEAELIKNGEYGVNFDTYMKFKLPNAIREDNKLGPASHGGNYDLSNSNNSFGVTHWNNTSTVNGVTPS
jgi:hypothetical protein